MLASRTNAEWTERLNTLGVAAGPIYAIDEVFADPQVQHLGIVADMKTRDRGPLQVMRQPVSLSRTPSAVAMPTPERGEHTETVLAEFGFSEHEIAALQKAKAI